MRRRPRQLALDFPQRGGARPGAGRPRRIPNPDLKGPGVPHLVRPDFAERFPVHVTMRVRRSVGNLRRWSVLRVVEQALRDGKERCGLRLIHYSIQSNHLHLIVEAAGAKGLSSGMTGLATRLARRINLRLKRAGEVFADRYHAHILRTRRETAHAVRYVVHNAAHHDERRSPHWEDPASSARYLRAAPEEGAPVVAPRVWLLRVGWLDEAVPVGPRKPSAAGRQTASVSVDPL